jgi:SAM-dependent methyltransferase
MNCRFCGKELFYEFIDLGSSPLSNSFLTEKELNLPEVYYPLKLFVCDNCFLVQTDEYVKSKEIFNKNYVYFSSYSRTWLDHSKKFAEMIIDKIKLNNKSLVVEVASNDGYLLQYFKEKNIPSIGIEPTKSTASIAKQKGLEIIEDFFGVNIANNIPKADLIIANNVLAHVPNINNFVEGLKIALKKNGTITIEFPHLLNLIKYNQFDTIYHEHFSYFSFMTVKHIFKTHELEIYDVEALDTHGGSLRIYAKHMQDNSKTINMNVFNMIEKEKKFGIDKINCYTDFQIKINLIKYKLLEYIIKIKLDGKIIGGYGAAAKGNTLINYCGIKKDIINFVADLSPHKQGKFLPGSHIPVVPEIEIKLQKPNFIMIFPWNIKNEIMEQLKYIRKWNGKFILTMPSLKIE